MLRLIASMFCRGFVADQPEKARLQLIDVSAGQLFEGYDAWIAAYREACLQVREQGKRRFPRLVAAIRDPGGKVKHHRLGHGMAGDQIPQHRVVVHSAPDLFAAYLAWSAGAA